MLIDAHCHLDHLGQQGASDFLAHLNDYGLDYVVGSAPNAEVWPFYQQLAQSYDVLKVCYGIHPLEITDQWETQLEKLRSFLPHCVAVGEIGLDFHGIFSQENIPQIKLQMKVFEKQIRIAQVYNLPIVIHCREAFFAVKEILQYTRMDMHRVLFHCFVEDLESAKWVLSEGGFVSYSGILTFKKPGNTHITAKYANPNQIVIETDSPCLAPSPFRGQTNSPQNVRFVAEKLAELKAIPLSQCVQYTSENTRRFFNF